MPTLTKSTRSVKDREIQRSWHLLDAKDAVLGRLASRAAQYLIGKHKVNFVPYLDSGDNVVVVNAKDVVVTGRKKDDKTYTRYSGYPGGLKVRTYEELKEKNPLEVVCHAISGMLPKNKLRKKRLTRLHVFADDKHPFEDKIKKSN